MLDEKYLSIREKVQSISTISIKINFMNIGQLCELLISLLEIMKRKEKITPTIFLDIHPSKFRNIKSLKKVKGSKSSSKKKKKQRGKKKIVPETPSQRQTASQLRPTQDPSQSVVIVPEEQCQSTAQTAPKVRFSRNEVIIIEEQDDSVQIKEK